MADEDRELWNSATTETAEPPVTEPVAEPPSDAGPVRDEQGRFAPKANEQATPPVTVTQPETQAAPAQRTPEEAAAIPTWRLREEAEARRSAEQQLADERRQREALQRQFAELQQANQPKVEPPNLYENPEGYQNHLQQTFETRMREQELNFSFRLAHREYKTEFEEAYQTLIQRGQMGDRTTVQAITGSSDPGEALVRWHRQQKLYEQTGGDLTGFLSKKQEELLNDPAFLAKAAEKIRSQGQNQSRPPVTNLPPSLNKVTSAASFDAGDDDMSDAGLLKQALRR